jgi:hypothetical protein
MVHHTRTLPSPEPWPTSACLNLKPQLGPHLPSAPFSKQQSGGLLNPPFRAHHPAQNPCWHLHGVQKGQGLSLFNRWDRSTEPSVMWLRPYGFASGGLTLMMPCSH